MYPKKLIMSDSGAFDLIKDHLLSQNERSISYDNSCTYRGYSEEYDEEAGDETYNRIYDGKACAVGCLISDDIYDDRHAELEENTVDDPYVTKAIMDTHPDWRIRRTSVILLKNLQYIHDKVDPALWKYIFTDAGVDVKYTALYDIEYHNTKRVKDIPWAAKLIEMGIASEMDELSHSFLVLTLNPLHGIPEYAGVNENA
jgi:hypothetical protein